MRIFVTGATGLIGRPLCDQLIEAGHEVRALSRRTPGEAGAGALQWVQGDVGRSGEWSAAVDGCDAVIHLAGESIAARRWTRRQKQRLVESRVDSTRQILAAVEASRSRPSALLSASATGYYGARGEEELDESAKPGSDFLAELCVAWEREAQRGETLGMRVVSLRFGVVLSAEGGALAQMLPPFRLGLGGPLGPSDRWFPWIHEADARGLLLHALAGTHAGPLNAVAPDAVRMGEFAATLGRVLKRPALLPLPLPLVRIGVGEVADHLVPGQRVIPRVAQESGYAFRYPQLEDALRACVGRPAG